MRLLLVLYCTYTNTTSYTHTYYTQNPCRMFHHFFSLHSASIFISFWLFAIWKYKKSLHIIRPSPHIHSAHSMFIRARKCVCIYVCIRVCVVYIIWMGVCNPIPCLKPSGLNGLTVASWHHNFNTFRPIIIKLSEKRRRFSCTAHTQTHWVREASVPPPSASMEQPSGTRTLIHCQNAVSPSPWSYIFHCKWWHGTGARACTTKSAGVGQCGGRVQVTTGAPNGCTSWSLLHSAFTLSISLSLFLSPRADVVIVHNAPMSDVRRASFIIRMNIYISTHSRTHVHSDGMIPNCNVRMCAGGQACIRATKRTVFSLFLAKMIME